MTAKKTAKKKTVKKETLPPVISGKDVFYLTVTVNHRVVTNMLRRSLGLDMPTNISHFPKDLEDIDHIVKAVKAYPGLINPKKMRGFCKVWDTMLDHWDKILDLHLEDDRRGMKQFLKEISAPYLTNPQTGNYTTSLYG